jgi:hypothetical protein
MQIYKWSFPIHQALLDPGIIRPNIPISGNLDDPSSCGSGKKISMLSLSKDAGLPYQRHVSTSPVCLYQRRWMFMVH